MIVEKHMIGQKVIVPYMEYTDSDILFNIKCIEMIFLQGRIRCETVSSNEI